MKLYNNIWTIIESEDKKSKDMAQKLGLLLPVAKYLVSKGIDNELLAKGYLNISTDFIFSKIRGIEDASNLINEYILKNKNILIYGDYDVDGITSTTILYDYLKNNGAKVKYFIPNRHTDGYGLNIDSIKKLESEFDLLITVDCGITAVKEVEYLKSIGKEILITDHHQPQLELPDCIIVNPKLDDESFQDLAGVGVVYKLLMELNKNNSKNLNDDYLVFVAVGTIADIMPLIGENRVLVKTGLEKFKSVNNIGLIKLLELSGIDANDVSTVDIGYNLAPKINALGRLSEADLAIELFNTNDEMFAVNTSQKLIDDNNKRKIIEKNIFDKAKIQVDKKDKFIVVKGEDWNEGVIGIVASRLVEKFHKPVIVFTEKDEILKGSGRSIGDFDIFKSLEVNEEIIKSFGGHKYAIGINLDKHKYIEFKNRIILYANENLKESDMVKKHKYICEIDSNYISHEFIKQIKLLEPFGKGNSMPMFLMKNVLVERHNLIGKDNNHLKLKLNINNRVIDGVCFGLAKLEKLFADGKEIDIITTLDTNEYLGVEYLNLYIKDFRLSNNMSIYKSIEYIKYRYKLSKAITNYDKKHFNMEAITYDYYIDKALENGENILIEYPDIEGKIDIGKIIDLKDNKYMDIFKKQLLNQLPERNDLILIYKWIKSNEGIPVGLEDFNYKIVFDINKFFVALDIFVEIGIVKYVFYGDNINIQMVNHDNKIKLELDKSQTYKNIKKFKEDWNEFKGQN